MKTPNFVEAILLMNVIYQLQFSSIEILPLKPDHFLSQSTVFRKTDSSSEANSSCFHKPDADHRVESSIISIDMSINVWRSCRKTMQEDH